MCEFFCGDRKKEEQDTQSGFASDELMVGHDVEMRFGFAMLFFSVRSATNGQGEEICVL